MTQEAVINVRLDTSQAKAALKDLDKEAEASAGRAGAELRDKLGKGAKALGIGAVGAIVGATGAVAATRGGIGAVLGEGLGAIGADLGRAFGTPEARASQAAREATIEAYGVLGRSANNDQAVQFYRATREILLRREEGAAAIEADRTGRFRSENVVSDVVNGIHGLTSAFQEWASQNRPW